MNIEYVSKKVVDYLAGDKFYKEPIKTLEDCLCMDGFEEMLVPDFINRYEKTNSDPNAWQEVNELYDVIKLYICEWLITLLQEQGNEIEEYNNLDDEDKKEVIYSACNIMLEATKSQLIKEYEAKRDIWQREPLLKGVH